jgi:hypothetical protein
MTADTSPNGSREDETDAVRYETRGRTEVITLNRPRYRNALAALTAGP